MLPSNSYVNTQKKFCHSTTHNLYASTQTNIRDTPYSIFDPLNSNLQELQTHNIEYKTQTNFQDPQTHKRPHSTKYHLTKILKPHLTKNLKPPARTQLPSTRHSTTNKKPLTHLTNLLNPSARTPPLTLLIISEKSLLILQPHMRTLEKTHLATHPHTTKPSNTK